MISRIGFAALLLSVSAHAAPLKKKDLSPEFSRRIQQHQLQVLNLKKLSQVVPSLQPPARPVSEVEEAGYLFFSADFNFSSREAKRIMARNLPADVTLVIYASPGANKANIQNAFSGQIAPERLKIVEIPGASRGFWTRDGFPVPVWSKNGQMDMVDARYYHGFEPDRTISGWFRNSLYKHDYYYEGGNFMVNDRGDCLMIDNDEASKIPQSVFSEMYGCTRLIRLPHEKGIGHVDETARFIKSNTIVTDSPTYADTLRGHGFEVLMLPRPNRNYETYVNALLVNNTIYVPVFNNPAKDEVALKVYRDAGLNAVPIETIDLANNGLGSIHCITFTYPKVPFEVLLKGLGAKEL